MTTTRRHAPPVIPEIAKAYQNDPRTQLALEAMKSGTSTAPVATGQYAYMDGIARALQATLGGYINRKQEDQYTADQDKLLAQRQARGVDGLTGAGATAAATPPPPAAQAAPTAPQAAPSAPPMPGAPTGTPANAAAVAAALGNPAAPIPVGPPSAPVSPSAPMSPPAPSAQGAGLVSRLPFVPSTPSGVGAPPSTPAAAPPPKINPALGQIAVPDAPAPIDMKSVADTIAKNTPAAVGPTRSKLLDAAYRIMADANPYESANGQDLYASGLSEQDKLNEAAAEREQRLRDMGFDVAAHTYGEGLTQDRNAKWQERHQIEQDNFTAGQGGLQRSFEGSENQKNRAATAANEAANRASQERIAGLRMSAMYGTAEANDAINQAMADGRLDPMAVTTRNRASLGSFLAAHPDASPLDIHAFAMGTSAESRAAGTRVGATDVATSEIPGLAAEASAAHAALKNTRNFVPWNKAVQQVQAHTSSPELARAVTAADAVAKAYARSFGTGAVAVSNYKDAQTKLQNAWGTPAFEAALNQMVRTTNLERAGAQSALHANAPSRAAATPSAGWGRVVVH